ncbi:feruloyl CoA ortho-hydroxylase F6H1-3-like [Malania oleifera]|uniref:feruloyl CoA ortho-hydroxylase F6H1-3-like n=1 Tax=Malania oleifera TaxID=397392 RepID=UPI0025AE6DB6|nr:feruloyl CoA ortho-hydroxylase F6H1-3-like [Malania oleifera]
MAPMTAATSMITDPLWDVNDFVIKKGNGVKGLSEMGLESLPNKYIQPLEERMDMMNKASQQEEESIPIIDMSKLNDPELADSICRAAEKWGFFQIVNHGVPVSLLENVRDVAHLFFALPAEEKRKYSKGQSPTPNVHYGTSFSPEAEKVLEWKDYLSLLYVSEDEAASFWPPVCTNKMDIKIRMDRVLEYMKKTELIIKQLLGILMKRLNVKEIDKTKENLLMGSRRINLNYYPICPNPELTVGVGRHSDVSTLTVLLQDDTGGLYVRGGISGDGWIHVPPIDGSLVINVGDVLQIMSNGRYKSVECWHRAFTNGSKNRVSVPIFVNPRPREIVCPLPEVLTDGEEPAYRQVPYSDYCRHFFSKAHDGKNTIELAKIGYCPV